MDAASIRSIQIGNTYVKNLHNELISTRFQLARARFFMLNHFYLCRHGLWFCLFAFIIANVMNKIHYICVFSDFL